MMTTNTKEDVKFDWNFKIPVFKSLLCINVKHGPFFDYFNIYQRHVPEQSLGLIWAYFVFL